MGTLKDLLARTLKPDAIVGGRYQLQRRLGQGGFGEVWAAVDLRSLAVGLHSRTCGVEGGTQQALPVGGATQAPVIVACKMMPHQWARVPEIQASLTQECVVLKTLAHPHICRVLDLVHDATYGPLLVTELVEGVDCVAATRGAAPESCWQVAIQILAALSYLHGRGVLHLDIKPANVLIGATGAKLIDFGLATVVAPKPGAGTLAYMAPERIRGEAVDVRADLYAVGVLLYQCLTGANPFHAPQPEAMRQKQLEWTPPPVSRVRADCPGWMDTMLTRLLAKNPADRYPSAKAVLNEFQLVLGDAAVHQVVGQSHTRAFASAAGQFIGRETIIAPLRTAWEQAAKGAPDAIRWVQIIGAPGMGKSRLLRELKFAAQLAGCQTAWFDAPADVTAVTIQPIAEALATARPPMVLCLDDYDRWGNDPDAHRLAGLLATMRTHPHPPTPIWSVVTCREPIRPEPAADITCFRLDPFTTAELTAYIRAVAPMPAVQRTGFVDAVWKRTDGVPVKVVMLMQELVARGYLATECGPWEERLFADIVIDLPEPPAVAETEVSVADPETLLTLCRHDRATGHAGRALAQLTACFRQRGSGPPPTVAGEDNADLVIEAAECALTIGRPQEVRAFLADFLDQCPDQRGPLLLWHGILLMAERSYAAAEAPLREALAWAQKNAECALEITVCNQLARLALLQRQYDRAVAGFRTTRTAMGALPPDVARRIVNNELGHALLLAGQLPEAVTILTEDIARCAAAAARRRKLRAQLWRAECWRLLGEGSKALADANVAAQEARRGQHLALLAEAYNGLGMLHCQRGASADGLEHYAQALALAYSVNDLATAVIVTTNMGLERLRRGEVLTARHSLETALCFLDQQGEATAIERAAVPTRIGLAEIARQEQRYAEALSLLAAAETIATQHHLLSQYQFPLVLTRAEIARDQGDRATARQLGRRAQPMARSPAEQTTWQTFMDSLDR